MIAVVSDQISKIQTLIDPATIDAVDSVGQTALFYAIKANRCAVAGLLLAAGANINHQDEDGMSVLMMTIDDNYLTNDDNYSDARLKFLLDKSADQNLVNKNKSNALLLATYSLNANAMRILLGRQPYNDEWDSAACECANNAFVEGLEIILQDYDMDPNHTRLNILEKALTNTDNPNIIAIIRMLIEQGLRITKDSFRTFTKYRINGDPEINMEILELLVDAL